MVERPHRIELTWEGKDEPGETNLVFEIEALDQGTAVTLIHSGYGADTLWDKAVTEAESSWPLALENLESVLTTGIDLREASRPILGIVPEQLTLERAAREDVGSDSGVYLANVVEDGGAAEAGLEPGDVITSIGGMAVHDSDSLTTTLASHRAGDRVQVVFVRGRVRRTAAVELKPRSMPEISFNPQQVVEHTLREQAAVMADLRHALAGVSEEVAEKRPSPDEWSVKETLVHLSLGELATQQWFQDMILGTTPGQMGGNPNTAKEMFAMVFATTPTVEALLARLERESAETLALFAALRPEVAAMKTRYRRMASRVRLWSSHARDHLKQINAAIESVKG
jgi:hypothetical protein